MWLNRRRRAQGAQILTGIFGADQVLMGTDYSGDMPAWRALLEIGKVELLTSKATGSR
jgi:hypothetical protein